MRVPSTCQRNPATPENSLIGQLKKGSPEAFEELVASYGERLYSVALRILRNPPDAEDAVQETLLKVLKSIDSFREDSSLYTWLYRIVCNQSIMRYRQRAKRKVISIESYLPRFEHGQHVEAFVDWKDQPDGELQSHELSQFYEECIDDLPENYRLAYILKDVERLSEDKVCRILRTSKPAMKNRVHRARLVIRKRVEERFFKKSG
jgi:RNA polymerase sigma-70 factor (ECF subfamily)